VLLPHVADWRWSTVNNTSVWYPAVRIFRQEQHGDWDGVIQNVSICLKEISMDRKYCHGQSMSITTTAKFSLEKMELERQLENNLKTFNNDTTCADALLDVGASLALLGRHAEAIDRFRKVLELDSEHIAGHLNLAYCLLESGEFPEGWHHFEWRLRRLSADQIPPWPFLNSLELGVAILGTSLLVHCEQGYGDTILFCRFLPLLADAGYRVIVSCQPPLSALVASVRGVSQIVEHGEHLPVCQRQVLMSSLACLFSATREKLPKTAPYLTPQSSSVKIWKARLKDKLQKGSYFSKVYS
jgi:tetratricopeptide (TPR) repeat protein